VPLKKLLDNSPNLEGGVVLGSRARGGVPPAIPPPTPPVTQGRVTVAAPIPPLSPTRSAPPSLSRSKPLQPCPEEGDEVPESPQIRVRPSAFEGSQTRSVQSVEYSQSGSTSSASRSESSERESKAPSPSQRSWRRILPKLNRRRYSSASGPRPPKK